MVSVSVCQLLMAAEYCLHVAERVASSLQFQASTTENKNCPLVIRVSSFRISKSVLSVNRYKKNEKQEFYIELLLFFVPLKQNTHIIIV
jgi:hypothetical protein